MTSPMVVRLEDLLGSFRRHLRAASKVPRTKALTECIETATAPDFDLTAWHEAQGSAATG